MLVKPVAVQHRDQHGVHNAVANDVGLGLQGAVVRRPAAVEPVFVRRETFPLANLSHLSPEVREPPSVHCHDLGHLHDVASAERGIEHLDFGKHRRGATQLVRLHHHKVGDLRIVLWCPLIVSDICQPGKRG